MYPIINRNNYEYKDISVSDNDELKPSTKQINTEAAEQVNSDV